MNQFYQKEIGGILGAILLSASPVFASQRPGYSPSYQEGEGGFIVLDTGDSSRVLNTLTNATLYKT